MIQAELHQLHLCRNWCAFGILKKIKNMVLIQIWFLHIRLYRQIGAVKNAIIVGLPLSEAGQGHQMLVHFAIPIT